jgi:hypothetical protein
MSKKDCLGYLICLNISLILSFMIEASLKL